MTENFINPPQPIPYPDNWLLKFLYRAPLLLYRLNLGKLIERYILILSTTGRKTKRVHRTPVEYFKQGNRVYIISGFNQQPDWLKNIQAEPWMKRVGKKLSHTLEVEKNDATETLTTEPARSSQEITVV